MESMERSLTKNDYYDGILRMPDVIFLGSFQDILKIDIISGRTISRRLSEESQWNTKVIKLPRSRLASSNQVIKIWKIQENPSFLKPILELKGHTGFIFDMVYLGSNVIVSASSDRTLRIWNTSDGTCLKIVRGTQVFGKLDVLSIDRCLFISACNDGNVKIWNWISGKCLRSFSNRKCVFSVLSIANENMILAGLHGTPSEIKCWDVESGRCISTLQHGNGRLYTMERIDSHHFVSGCEDSTIKLWKINDSIRTEGTINNCMRTFEGHRAMILYLCRFFSPKMFFSCQTGFNSTDGIKLWSTESGHCLKTYDYLSKGIVTMGSLRTKRQRRKDNKKIMVRIEEGSVVTELVKIKISQDAVCWEFPRLLLESDTQDSEVVLNKINNNIYQNPILKHQSDSPKMKVDQDLLYDVFMNCLFGEDCDDDEDEYESILFDLYELFDSLGMKNHSIVILHKLCDLKTNALLFVFLKSLLRHEKDRIDERNFSPKAEDYIPDQIPFSLICDDGDDQVSGLVDFSTTLESTKFSISNLLEQKSSGEKFVDDDDDEEEEEEGSGDHPINMNQYLNDGTTTSTSTTTMTNTTTTTTENSSSSSSTTTTTELNHHQYGIPFKKTAFRNPFAYVCFRELKKRKVEISKNPIFLKHLEQIGILKNIFFFREDMMASLSSSSRSGPGRPGRTTFISSLIRFFHEKEKQENSVFVGSERKRYNYDLDRMYLDEEEMSFEKLYKLRLRKLYETKECSNLTLRTKDCETEFKVHKEILMNRSRFFSQMFFFDGVESDGVEVMIEFLSAEQLQVLLNWIYTGRLHLYEDEKKKSFLPLFDRKRDKESKVIPLLELYRHCEMYGDHELKFLIRNELIDLFNQFGAPDTTDSSSFISRKKNNEEEEEEEKFYSYIADEEEEENTEIENLLLRVGHIFETLPDLGEDIFVNSDWVKRKKIGGYRSIRTLIRCSSRVQEYVEKLDESKMRMVKKRRRKDEGSSRKKKRRKIMSDGDGVDETGFSLPPPPPQLYIFDFGATDEQEVRLMNDQHQQQKPSRI